MYSVGDILYIISNKKRQVLPAQVVEQINRRTLAGEQIQYQVLIAGSERPVDIDTLADVGSIFTSLDDARNSLRVQAETAISHVVNAAMELANSYFANGVQRNSPEIELHEEPQFVSGDIISPREKKLKVKLPDGTSASVSMPDV
jgi:hypothetical protein